MQGRKHHHNGNHQDGQSVIDILNLDCNILRQRRLSAYGIIFDDDGNFLTESELELIWNSLWERDTNNKHQRFFFALLNIIYDII